MKLMAHRHLGPGRLVIATHNAGKLREIAALVAPFGIDAVSAGSLGLPEPEETGTTYRANAELKAHAAAQAAQLPALADDSGVAIEALDGAPGIYTARWAGPTKDFRIAMERANRELGDNPNRRAHFVCCLALAWPDGHAETFQSEWPGTLTWPPRGDRGFGYDPMFVPEGQTQTAGEMDPALKHALSHRAQAFRQLVEACLEA
jgi:XTP/dITP diphosphohydrolase